MRPIHPPPLVRNPSHLLSLSASCHCQLRHRTTKNPGPPPGFRTEFDHSSKIRWHPTHQSKALRQLKDGLHHIDMIVEMRDARIPVTSINPAFEDVLGRRERLVVYNKADLANHNTRKVGTKYRNENSILWTTANVGSNVKMIIEHAIDKCKREPHRYPYLSMIIVGVPNVGKSTMMNKLRELGVHKGKASEVGMRAGVTRKIQTRVKIWEDPAIYLVDTPGIFDPHYSHPIEGLKIALTGMLSGALQNVS
ncbi:Mitochondrial GTPase [Rhizophlyctis rosea]|uniref:Mitochondrial GTPase n=1 Tax=Rhizophlyctis rosea TaxID=64517 RepID=A0AAD5S7I7_9FUNG|nr:Mitochondrial GTPase [Rhizophlyctis rosea]